MKSIKTLFRSWQSPEIRLLTYALLVAVTAVTSVGFFTDRVDRAMRSQATALFGADLVIQSSRAISNEYEAAAEELGLQTARTIEFPSVVLAGDESSLVQVKAVSSPYPLRGTLETSRSVDEAGLPTTDTLPDKEVWVEANVLYRLNINMGDQIQLGEETFTVGRIVTFAADNGGSLFQLAPKVLMPMSRLEATGLLSAGSRASYRFLAAGASARVAELEETLKPELTDSETLQTAEDGRPEVNNALDRASRFMGLATILTVVLAGTAVALASVSYTRQEAMHIAVMKSLGFTRQQLVRRYVSQLGLIVVATTLIGSALGFLSQFALAQLLSGWIQVELPTASFRPVLSGLVTAVLTLAGFTLPAMIRLLATPPSRILRNEPSAVGLSAPLTAISIAIAIWLFLIWQAEDLKLASLVFLGVLASLAVLYFIAHLVTGLMRRLPLKNGAGWRLGLRNAGRYRQRSALLIAAFGISVLTLMMLSSVRQDLMAAWQASVPDDAPNHFLINIQPHEEEAVSAFLAARGNPKHTLYPMIRGRLLAINDRTVSEADYEQPRAKRLVSREFNLSASDTLPAANTIVEGDWETSLSTGELSVESGIAETLGFGMGDQLTFDVAGRRFTRTIGNIREVDWDTMQPNFFVIIPPQLAEPYPATYITSLHVDDDDRRFTADLVKAFPAVTVLDVRTILTQVRRIISQASAAVQYVFAFTVLAGIVVLLAAVQTQRHERKQEIAVLKTLGAGQQKINQAVAGEFALIGSLAGLIGGSLALAAGWLMARYIFSLDFVGNPGALALFVALSTALVGAVGLAGVKSLLSTKPIALLRGS